MRKMKKMLCILLSALLLLTIGAVAASAQEPAQPDMEELHQKFTKYLDEQGVDHKNGDEESSCVEYIVETNGWTVFFGSSKAGSPMIISDRIGNYVLVHSSWERPYKIGLYTEKQGQLLTLKEASQTQNIDIERIVENLPKYIDVYDPGDINMDGSISVKDVLDVQKAIAKQVVLIEPFDLAFYDYDGNGEITVKDVLDMQKLIAKVKG